MPKQTRPIALRLRLASVIGVALTLSLGTAVAAPQIASASCSESTKFVNEYASNPSIDIGTNYFGEQGSAYAYNHLPICTLGPNEPGGVAESFVFKLSPDFANWVETGIRQYATDSPGQTHDWGEWQYFPAFAQVRNFDSQAGILTTGTTYSVKLQNGVGTSWDMYIAHTSSPGSSWNHVFNTGNLSAYYGVPESEMSRYGDGDASDHPKYLQRQATYLGSWANWQHLGCDVSFDNMHDWAVTKVSDTEWYMVHSAPVSGQC